MSQMTQITDRLLELVQHVHGTFGFGGILAHFRRLNGPQSVGQFDVKLCMVKHNNVHHLSIIIQRLNGGHGIL